MDPARKLSADELRLDIVPEQFGYVDTSELQPLGQIIGQPRALEALDVAVGVLHQDYHIYAAGMVGTGKLELLQRALIERVSGAPVPPDWVYVNNFQESDRPLAIDLPPGQAVHLRDAVRQLLERLAETIPKAFREEDFSREKDRLRKDYRRRGEELLDDLAKFARERGLAVRQTEEGNIVFIPAAEDGTPMSPDDVSKISEERMQELNSHQEELFAKAAQVLEQQQAVMLQLNADVREAVRAFAERLVAPRIQELSNRFVVPKLQNWLLQLQQHMVDHIDRFNVEEEAANRGKTFADVRELATKRFTDYQVNVIVDNGQLQTPPVVIESSPNYKNLFGTIERIVDRNGRVITSFSRIKAGSLLKANGGYLVFDIIDALSEPFVWRELKRTLKSGQIQIEVFDPFSMFTVSALKPEPIPLKLKLAAAGPVLIYHLLCLYDEDFSRVFRVKADFDNEIMRSSDAGLLYGQLARKLADTEGLRPFAAEGVGELIRCGARFAEHRQKISTEFTYLADICREADFWARRRGAERVTAEDIRKASERRVYRSDLLAEKLRELVQDGTLLIDLQGVAVGRINGLSVANLGDYSFGRPTRLSASVGVGTAGVVNIERESRLSGRTFDKALLILEGYLRNRYAQGHPLALSASIAMEQSYGQIDGDSASVAELLVLLSVLAGVPLRQDVAVTGSINQWGDVQAIGGVNQKVEGFYDVCRQTRLMGTQGVCLPASNLKNLVLRADVLDAVERGEFHIWAITHVDQAIELLSGQSAGDVDVEGSFHSVVAGRLKAMHEVLKGQISVAQPAISTPAPLTSPLDPRPPLPGREDLA